MKFNVTQIISNDIIVDKQYVLHEVAHRLSVQIANEVLNDEDYLIKREVGSNETIERYEVYVFSFEQLNELIRRKIGDAYRGIPILL